jgi:tetratricopeptide (TPR) repeat protein
LSLSEVLYRQGRYEEALAFLDPDDVTVGARRGKILARLGDPAESERRARLAVESWEGSDYLVDRANALMDLAEVLRLAGRPEESSRVVADALRLYDQKGSLLLADRARSILRDYPPSSADWASASAPRTPARGPSAGGVM